MKNTFAKILSLFFLTIILASHTLNLHVYSHQDDETHSSIDTEHNSDDKENSTCDLCLLVTNLNDLDYTNTLEYTYNNKGVTLPFINQKGFNYCNPNHTSLFLSFNNNKAPPYRI